MELSEALTDNEFSLRDEVGAQYLAALDPADIQKLVQATVRAGDPKTFNAILASGALNDPRNAATAQQVLVYWYSGLVGDRTADYLEALAWESHGRRPCRGVLHPARVPRLGEEAVMIRTDVVVVGSGVAGALVAFQLAKAGVKVTILEAGPPVDRDEAVEVFRAATAKVPESPYPNTAWAPHPTVLEIGVTRNRLLHPGRPGPVRLHLRADRRRHHLALARHHPAAAAQRLPDEDPVRGRRELADQLCRPGAVVRQGRVRDRRGRGQRQRPGLAPVEGLPDAEGAHLVPGLGDRQGGPHHRTEGRVDPAGPEHRDLQRPAPLRRQLQLHPDLPDRGEVRRADPPGPGRRARSQADPGRGRARHPAQHRRHRAWCGLPASQRHRRDGAGPCRGDGGERHRDPEDHAQRQRRSRCWQLLGPGGPEPDGPPDPAVVRTVRAAGVRPAGATFHRRDRVHPAVRSARPALGVPGRGRQRRLEVPDRRPHLRVHRPAGRRSRSWVSVRAVPSWRGVGATMCPGSSGSAR